MDVRERTALMNKYRREADKHKIGSAYRIGEYIAYRLRGISEQRALYKVRSKTTVGP